MPGWLSRLLGHVHTALSDRGDTQHITALLRQLDSRKTSADRQRALFAQAQSAPAFTEALGRATLSSGQLAHGRQPNVRSPRPPGSWTAGPADSTETLAPSRR